MDSRGAPGQWSEPELEEDRQYTQPPIAGSSEEVVGSENLNLQRITFDDTQYPLSSLRSTLQSRGFEDAAVQSIGRAQASLSRILEQQLGNGDNITEEARRILISRPPPSPNSSWNPQMAAAIHQRYSQRNSGADSSLVASINRPSHHAILPGSNSGANYEPPHTRISNTEIANESLGAPVQSPSNGQGVDYHESSMTRLANRYSRGNMLAASYINDPPPRRISTLPGQDVSEGREVVNSQVPVSWEHGVLWGLGGGEIDQSRMSHPGYNTEIGNTYQNNTAVIAAMDSPRVTEDTTINSPDEMDIDVEVQAEQPIASIPVVSTEIQSVNLPEITIEPTIQPTIELTMEPTMEPTTESDIPTEETTPGPMKKNCGLCMEEYEGEEVIATQFPYTCGHCGNNMYCLKCIKDWFLDACKNEAKMPPKCCFAIPLATISENLSIAEIDLFKAKHEEWNTADRMYCPVLSCSAFIPPRLYVQLLKAEVSPSPPSENEMAGLGSTIPTPTATKPSVSCPDCYTLVCTQCRTPTHAGECPETDIDPALEEQLEKWRIKRCPKCRTGVRKVFGCSHVLCRCGASFCFECLQAINVCGGGCGDDDEDDGDFEDDDLDGQAGYHDGDGNEFGEEPRVSIADRWGCQHSWSAPVRPHQEGECQSCFRTVVFCGDDEKDPATNRIAWECRCGQVVCGDCQGDQ